MLASRWEIEAIEVAPNQPEKGQFRNCPFSGYYRMYLSPDNSKISLKPPFQGGWGIEI
jgi:hypothetical protein